MALGRNGDDGEMASEGAIWPLQEQIESCHGKEVGGRKMEKVGHSVAALRLPLVVARGGHQAMELPKKRFEGRLLGYGFGAGIENGGCAGPEIWLQAPG